MTPIYIYGITVCVYGLLDIFLQKNSKTIIFSKSKDWTYLPILITFILTLTLVPYEYLSFDRAVSSFNILFGLTICLGATVIRAKGQLDLQHGFSTRIEKQDNHKLVTAGIYSIVRHPLYLAIVLLLIGTSIMLSSRFSWILIVANIYSLKIRIEKEEAFMIKNFPEYESYKKRTRKIIPFLW